MSSILADLPPEARGIADLLSNRVWRLNNLYYIKDKFGKKVRFRMNISQQWLLANMWYLNIVLKARQLGFSTFIDIFMLDLCLFNENITAGIVADTLENAKKLFETKIQFPFQNLPGWLQEGLKAKTDSKTEMSWVNGSGIGVGTSLRGGTYNMVHVSEFGEISHKFPDKAEEIVTGAFNTVQAGQFIFVESTHKGGKGGHFYDMTKMAMQNIGRQLTVMDFRFHFFPWYMEPNYVLDPQFVQLDQETELYLAELAAEVQVEFSPAQKAWYFKKKQQQKYKIYQEYPSTAAEAFKVQIEGAIYGDDVSAARASGRVTKVPMDRSVPVYTFWDIGLDMMAIWFAQFIGQQVNLIDYWADSDADLRDAALEVNSRGLKLDYYYGGHYLPHDGKNRDKKNKVLTYDQFLKDLAIPCVVLPRIPSLDIGIDLVKGIFNKCHFDIDKTATDPVMPPGQERKNSHCGLGALESYHQRWNPILNAWDGEPVHDWASHGASAFMQMGIALREGRIQDNSIITRMEAQQRNVRAMPDRMDDADWDPIYDPKR